MRHELPFEEWLNEAYQHVQTKARPIIISSGDVHDDWFCGFDPRETVDRIDEGRHRHFKLVNTGGIAVMLSARSPVANVNAQVQALLN